MLNVWNARNATGFYMVSQHIFNCDNSLICGETDNESTHDLMAHMLFKKCLGGRCMSSDMYGWMEHLNNKNSESISVLIKSILFMVLVIFINEREDTMPVFALKKL